LFPGLGAALEPTPPLLPIADPANLNSPDPTIKAAAEIKSQEDAAPQKIAALRYLATVGCGCYEGMDEAFLEAMKDCTEEVRYEAVLAIRATACKCGHGGDGSCGLCDYGSCCSAEIRKKLQELAYESDDDGCPKEPSERVRRQARLALQECGPAPPEPEAPKPAETGPQEGPAEGPADGAEEGAEGEAEQGADEESNETPPAEDDPASEPAEQNGETTAQVKTIRTSRSTAPGGLISTAAGSVEARPSGTVNPDLSLEAVQRPSALPRRIPPPAEDNPASEPAAQNGETTAQVKSIRSSRSTALSGLISTTAGSVEASPEGTVITDLSPQRVQLPSALPRRTFPPAEENPASEHAEQSGETTAPVESIRTSQSTAPGIPISTAAGSAETGPAGTVISDGSPQPVQRPSALPRRTPHFFRTSTVPRQTARRPL
jgi:hypothetical protein